MIVASRFLLAKVLGTQILILTIGCNVLAIEALAGEKRSLSVGEVLEEAVQLAQPISGVERARMLARIAAVHQETGSPQIAFSLFNQATSAVGQFDDAESRRQIQVLREIISVERKSENREALVKTLATAVPFIAKQAAATSAKYPAKAESIRLDEMLNLADIHAAAGDADKAKAILQDIVPALPQLKWEQQGLLRQGLARAQAQVGDDKAALATLSENEAYFVRFSRAYNQPLEPYLHEVHSIGFVVKEQFLAGHRQAAQETLKKAYAKAKAIPTRSDGQSDDSVRSAALRTVTWYATEIGLTALAVEAQRSITNTAYRSALSLVIRALARDGDNSLARKLAGENKCCKRLLALGLAEHGDWESSVEADETSHGDEVGWEWDENYFMEVAKARLLARGVGEALTWARQKPKTASEKILALLGVSEGLVAKEAAEKVIQKE